MAFVSLLLVVGLILLVYYLLKNNSSANAFNPMGMAARKYKNQRIEDYWRQWNQKKAFFQEAKDGCVYLLEWWQQYANDAPNTGHPSVPTLLHRGRVQAVQGLKVMDELEGEFFKLLEQEDKEKDVTHSAEMYLEAVLFTQDHIYREQDRATNAQVFLGKLHPELPESVAGIFDDIAGKLNNVNGWAGYKQEFAKYCQRLTELLDSPALNSRVEEHRQRLQRFPDPNQVPEQNLQSDNAVDRLDNRLDTWETVGTIALLAHFMNQDSK